jgi:tetratricopeptide (TPR) repeat protein
MSPPPPPTGIDRTELLLRTWSLLRRGELADLCILLESAPPELVVEEPELGVNLLSAYLLLYRTGDARTLEARLGPVMARWPNDRIHRRFVTLQALLLFRVGELGGSEDRLREAEWMSTTAGDDYVLAWVTERMAVHAIVRCEYEDALRLHHRALAFNQRGSDPHQAGGIEHNLAETYREMGLFSHARRYLERATSREQIPPPERTAHDATRACLYLDVGELEMAEIFADRVVERGRELGGAGVEAAGLHILGNIAALQGRQALAIERLDRALALSGQDEIIRASIFEDQALTHARFGNAVDALEAEMHAVALFERWGAPRRVERLRLRLAVQAVERSG